MTDKARVKASYNYNKKATTQLNIRLNIKTDKDVIDHIDKIKNSGESVRGYLIELIRKDIKGANN